MSRRRGVSRSIVVVAVIVLLIIVAAGYGLYAIRSNSLATTEKSGGVVTVVIPNDVASNISLDFQPATMTVVIGINNTIDWVNQDSAQHTVTSVSAPPGSSSFDSGTLNKGATFSVTLTAVGTYQYHCSIHPGWMKGTIVVVGAAQGSSTKLGGY